MVNHIFNVKCQACGEIVHFLDPNFCSYCGAELSNETKSKAETMTDIEWKEYQCHQRSW